jgi:hypothetical protein
MPAKQEKTHAQTPFPARSGGPVRAGQAQQLKTPPVRLYRSENYLNMATPMPASRPTTSPSQFPARAYTVQRRAARAEGARARGAFGPQSGRSARITAKSTCRSR